MNDFFQAVGAMFKKPSPTDNEARKVRQVIGAMHQITELNECGVLCNVCTAEALAPLYTKLMHSGNQFAMALNHHQEQCGE